MGKARLFTYEGMPLTPAVFSILLALTGQERHGYDILKQVAADSGGTVKLGPGTLYATIKRLLAEGLIAEVAERPEQDDERRRYYRLTGSGEAVLAAELKRFAAALHVARERIGPAVVEG